MWKSSRMRQTWGCLNPLRATFFLHKPAQGKAWRHRTRERNHSSQPSLEPSGWAAVGAEVPGLERGGPLREARAALAPAGS